MDIKIAYTGHRPDKIYGYNLSHPKYLQLKNCIIKVIEYIVNKNNVDKIINITGGALGFDTIAFQIGEFLKEFIDLKQVLAIPFEEQYIRWNKNDIDNYNNMKNNSLCIYVDELDDYSLKYCPTRKYNPAKMQKRNEWMVDNCDVLIACWNGNKFGGTYNCISYAKKINKSIIYINPNTLQIDYNL